MLRAFPSSIISCRIYRPGVCGRLPLTDAPVGVKYLTLATLPSCEVIPLTDVVLSISSDVSTGSIPRRVGVMRAIVPSALNVSLSAQTSRW